MGMLISDRRLGSTGLPSFLCRAEADEVGEALQQFLSAFLLFSARILSRENRFGLRGGDMYGVSSFSTVGSHLETLPPEEREGRECSETKHEVEEEEEDDETAVFFCRTPRTLCFSGSLASSTAISA
jgi:hypothetical protein